MSIIRASELNIEYDANYYLKEKAKSIYMELCSLSYEPVFTTKQGRSFHQYYMITSYGNHEMIYVHNNNKSTTVKPWSALLQSLKEDVEKQTSYKFNHAILKFYESNVEKVNLDKEKECCLVPGAPIVTLSFGASRNLGFKRRGYAPVCMQIDGGSLYTVKAPTNKYWSYEIAANRSDDEGYISVTFRNVSASCLNDRIFNLPIIF